MNINAYSLGEKVVHKTIGECAFMNYDIENNKCRVMIINKNGNDKVVSVNELDLEADLS